MNFQLSLEGSTSTPPPSGSSSSSICSSSSECSGRSTATFQPSPSSPSDHQFNGPYSGSLKAGNSLMAASLEQMKGSYPSGVLNRLDGYSREEDMRPNHKDIVKRNNMFITPSMMSIEGIFM